MLHLPDYKDSTEHPHAGWENGEVLDFGHMLTRDPSDKTSGTPSYAMPPSDAQRGRRFGRIDFNTNLDGPIKRWYEQLPSGSDTSFEKLDEASVLLGLFTRLPPMRFQPGDGHDRIELRRLCGRLWDASSPISAGNLMVFAHSQPASPLPFNLEVDGDKVIGEGMTYYQISVPIDRSKASLPPAPVTQPVETPESTTQPTSRPVKPRELLDKKPLSSGSAKSGTEPGVSVWPL